MSLADLADRAFDLVRGPVAGGALPGATLGIVDRDGQVELRYAGFAERQPEERPLAADAWFDLASLTKVILTTTAVLRLAEDGRLDLEAPLALPLPDLLQVTAGHPLRQRTPAQLLSHTAGLPAWAPLYTLGIPPDTLKAYVMQREWPLGDDVYSDLGFILLGILVERLSGTPLRRQPQALGLGPGLGFDPPRANTVSTEHCQWRGRVLRGEVHDENAFAFGGVAGHAGLFGTAAGVLGFAHRLLAADLLAPATLDRLAVRRGATHGLGWQVRHAGWLGGDTCGERTIGHTGFTGTGLWIDFDRGLAWTLLTNRVHPSRHRETPLQAVRRAVGDCIAGGGG